MSHEDLYNKYPFLESERITLKQIEEKDADSLFEIYSNDDIFRYRPGKAKRNKAAVGNMVGHFLRDFNK